MNTEQSKPGRADGSGRRAVRRALISVSDKTGLAELARGLTGAGVQLVATGSTARAIADAGVEVSRVEDLTGFPECLDGRVKTLHPNLHAGLLADTRREAHIDQLTGLGIEPFELLISNLYPFRETLAAGGSADECIEQIDIGGPAMVRSAAKNHACVAVVSSPSWYDETLAAVRAGGFTLAQRRRLATEAFAHTAGYDVAVATWLSAVVAPPADGSGFPDWVGATWQRSELLRYGENPHQQAALYRHWRDGLAAAEQLGGKPMSYNNFVDTDAARRAVYDFTEPSVAVIKHANPCGIALGADVAEAHRKAHACDPVSAYGGVVAANRPVSVAMAEQVAEIFTEVIVAPGYDDGAVEVLQRRKTLRVLVCAADEQPDPIELRPISGGLLVQTVDRIDADGDRPDSWQLASGEPADAGLLTELEFAWRAVRAARSNAILLAADRASVGIGMGQVNRLDACRLAVSRAGERATGSVAASDAYFPFADGLQVLLEAGVRAVVQPGGSIRDDDVIATAAAAGVTMYLTGARHFAH